MKLIVAADQNWGIGYKGSLLLRIPEDMRYFKEKTLNHVVIMGRGTYESLPGQRPLPDRVNIVLSQSLSDKRVIVCRCLSELLETAEQYRSKELYVIGGESVYSLLLPYCTEAYITRIRQAFPADKFIKNIEEDPAWQLASESDWKYCGDIPYRFTTFKKVK